MFFHSYMYKLRQYSNNPKNIRKLLKRLKKLGKQIRKLYWIIRLIEFALLSFLD